MLTWQQQRWRASSGPLLHVSLWKEVVELVQHPGLDLLVVQVHDRVITQTNGLALKGLCPSRAWQQGQRGILARHVAEPGPGGEEVQATSSSMETDPNAWPDDVQVEEEENYIVVGDIWESLGLTESVGVKPGIGDGSVSASMSGWGSGGSAPTYSHSSHLRPWYLVVSEGGRLL